MTKMPANHLLAERAIIALSAILNRAGALTEQIRNDYGEDLLVQSHLNGYADNFRLLIQVKGANLRCRSDGTKTFRLKTDHLVRWVSHSEPVLVCIFDDKTKITYAFSPNERFSLWQLATSRQETISVKLTSRDIFNVNTAKQFIWKCRIGHWSRMLSWYENHYQYSEQLGIAAAPHQKKIKMDGSVVILSFLKAVKIIEDDQVSKVFRQKIRNVSKNFSKSPDLKDLDMCSAFTLALLAQVDEICGVSLPGNLLSHGTNLCGGFFYSWHLKEWHRANKLLPDKGWRPYIQKNNQPDDKRRS